MPLATSVKGMASGESQGLSQEKVAVSYGRQRQETIDDKPADGELPHGED